MRTKQSASYLSKTDYTPGPWKYRVRTTANYENMHYVEQWRVERTRTEGPLRVTQPVCDVTGTRRKALELARQLNGVAQLTVKLAVQHSETLHWMHTAARLLANNKRATRNALRAIAANVTGKGERRCTRVN